MGVEGDFRDEDPMSVVRSIGKDHDFENRQSEQNVCISYVEKSTSTSRLYLNNPKWKYKEK